MEPEIIGGFEVRRSSNGAVTLYSKDSKSSGICIAIEKKRRMLHITGWYDNIVGINSCQLSLDDLVKLFGKTPRQRKKE